MRGHNGVLVEPDPALAASIKRVRPRDICIEVGVGPAECDEGVGEIFRCLEYKDAEYVFEEDAPPLSRNGHYIEDVRDIRMMGLWMKSLAERFPLISSTFCQSTLRALI